MSLVDSFMSKVIDLDEKEKEETILFLANALLCERDNNFVRNISKKVTLIVLPFLTDILINHIKNNGGEKVGSIGTGKKSETN